MSIDKAVTGNSSAFTIFTIWGAIVGTSVLTVPWAIAKTGFGTSIFVFLIIGVIAFYTCHLIVKNSNRVAEKKRLEQPNVYIELPEFRVVIEHYLGRAGAIVGLIGINVLMLAVVIVFYILMVKFLYGFGASCVQITKAWTRANLTDDLQDLHEFVVDGRCRIGAPWISATDPGWFIIDRFPLNPWLWTGWDLRTTVPLYCLTLFGLLNFKNMKFFYRLSIIGTLVVIMLAIIMIVKAAKFSKFTISDEERYSNPFDTDGPAVLVGFLSGSYFVHSGITNLVKDNKNQKNNTRDMLIAYVLVVISYLFFGLLYYFTFPGPRWCMADIFMEDFDKRDGVIPFAYALMFVRMVTATPILTDIMRQQTFETLLGTSWPGYLPVMALNFVIIIISCLFAVFFDKIGDILRFGCGFGGMIYMYILPCCVEMVAQKRETGKIPAWSYVLHILIILVGIASFVIQIPVRAY